MTTSTARVQAMRARKKAEGLEQLEVYVHPDDRDQVKRYVDRLTQKRRKNSK